MSLGTEGLPWTKQHRHQRRLQHYRYLLSPCKRWQAERDSQFTDVEAGNTRTYARVVNRTITLNAQCRACRHVDCRRSCARFWGVASEICALDVGHLREKHISSGKVSSSGQSYGSAAVVVVGLSDIGPRSRILAIHSQRGKRICVGLNIRAAHIIREDDVQWAQTWLRVAHRLARRRRDLEENILGWDALENR